MTTSKPIMSTVYLVRLAALTAIVVVLSYFEQFIKFGPFNITLALVPIVIGAALNGPIAGGWLGFIFGGVVLISGQAAAFIGVDTFGTIFIVLLKGIACGLVPGLLYKILSGKNKTAAAVIAALSAPIANTGVFILGCFLRFLPIVSEWAAAAGYENAGTFIILGLAGTNFLVEFISTAVLSGAVVRIVELGRRKTI